MRKIFSVLCSLVVGVLAVGNLAFAEEISHFDVLAKLSADRHLQITETIAYDFGDLERHGVFRLIPNVYDRNGNTYSLRLKFTSATMDGQPVKWAVSTQDTNQQIKIGDPDILITGPHVYAFTYETDRAINEFPDHDELYWNVTGDEWGVSINKTTFHLDAPGTINRSACYTGPRGSQETNCSVTSTGSTMDVMTNNSLNDNEGLTIVASFPKGVFPALTLQQSISQFVQDNWGVFLPFLVLIAMFGMWRKFGREPKGRGVVVAQYEAPRGLPPGLMETLLHQGVSRSAIAGTILDMARRGFLQVTWDEKDPKNISLVKKNEPDQQVRSFESMIWKALFATADTVSMRSAPQSFAIALPRIKAEMIGELTKMKLFRRNPSTTRAGWIALGAVIAGYGLFYAAGSALTFALVLSGAVIAIFGWFMPQMTKEGAMLNEEILGFKLFLSVTETERLKFTDAPKKQPSQFAEFLPAAVAFGVEEQWSKQFAGMMVEQPTYVTGNGMFNAMLFSHAFHSAGTTLAGVQVKSAGGGGSGFSGGGGGGFGGGGGGSW